MIARTVQDILLEDAAVFGLVADRIDTGDRRQGDPLPGVTVYLRTAQDIEDLRQHQGGSRIQTGTVAVACFAASQSDADEVADIAAQALTRAQGPRIVGDQTVRVLFLGEIQTDTIRRDPEQGRDTPAVYGTQLVARFVIQTPRT